MPPKPAQPTAVTPSGTTTYMYRPGLNTRGGTRGNAPMAASEIREAPTNENQDGGDAGGIEL